jgi:hypothetical protein
VSVSSTKAGESYTQRIFIICTHPQAGSIWLSIGTNGGLMWTQ